jgi:hypothetical protein
MGALSPVKTLNIVVLPLLGKPIIPIRIKDLILSLHKNTHRLSGGLDFDCYSRGWPKFEQLGSVDPTTATTASYRTSQ